LPQQVDEIPLTVEPWLLPIHNALTEYANERQEKAIKEAQAKSKRG